MYDIQIEDGGICMCNLSLFLDLTISLSLPLNILNFLSLYLNILNLIEHIIHIQVTVI